MRLVMRVLERFVGDKLCRTCCGPSNPELDSGDDKTRFKGILKDSV